MNKKLLSLFLTICIVIGISSSAYALPSNIIVIGNQAFEIGVLFEPEYLDIINEAIENAEGRLFYSLESMDMEFKSLFEDEIITPEEKLLFSNIKLTKANGEIAIYHTFDDEEPTILSMAVSMENIASQKILLGGTINLPTEIKVTLNDDANTEKMADVTWTLGDFDNTEVGTYEIIGKLTAKAADEYTFSATLKPMLSVIVEATPSGTANVSVDIASISTFKQITVNSLTNGTQYMIDGVVGYKAIGETVTTITTEKTLKISVYDGTTFVSSFFVDVDSEATADYNYALDGTEAKNATIAVDIGTISTFKTIMVKSSDLGTKFKVDYSTNIVSIGEYIMINTEETKANVYILDASDAVLDTIEVDISSASNMSYTLN